MAWWLAPDIKTLRPEIESYLKEELELEEVKLGWLSWYWAGHLGITSDECSFETRDGSIRVEGGRIAVYFSMWDMIRGNFYPDSIHLRDGDMRVDVKEGNGVAPGKVLPPARIVLDNMHLSWKAKGYAGEVSGLALNMDAGERQLLVRFPGLHAEASLGEDGLPQQLSGEFAGLDWVPAGLLPWLEGDVAGKFQLSRQHDLSWRGEFHLSSGTGGAFVMRQADFTLPFSAMDTEFELELSRSETGGVALKQIIIPRIDWKSGENGVTGKGLWQDGRLQMVASTGKLSMPMLWSWLRPLDDGNWDTWLGRMKAGTITHAEAKLFLDWPQPLSAFPDKAALQAIKYQVRGTVEDADVALGLDAGSIVKTSASVEVDEKGLKADIGHTEFPEMAAAASGELRILWKTLVLEISGKGNADAGKLHVWLDADGAQELGWQSAPATGDFSLSWKPAEEKPRAVTVRLQPEEPWQAMPNGVPAQIATGTVEWRLNEGLHLDGVSIETPHLTGTVSARAKHQPGKEWKIDEFQGEGHGSLSVIADYFHLPVEAPGGDMAVRLELDQEWHGAVDFMNASWSNLLGVGKKVGEPFQVRFIGDISRQGVVELKEIDCQEKQLQLRGKGSWSNAGLKLQLRQLKTVAFDGSVKVKAPFGPDPWELDVQARYLNRAALPKTLSWNPATEAKPWALRATIDRFDWDDARMENASIRLASAQNSVGVFKADTVRTEALKLDSVSAMFALPGLGHVDLRHFTASLDQLKLVLSATLVPGLDGGVHWSGFATLAGNFGNMMKRAELSDLFEEGDMHVLFSGQGVLLREQPWWQGLSGRLRLRVDDGRIMKGGTLSKLLAAVNVMELPALFSGDRKDLTEKGLFYRRLQSEALLQSKSVEVRQFALRSSAMDIAGHGKMDVDNGQADMIFVARPFQNLDALLSKVPLVRDLIGGSAHSLVRRVYHLYGPIADATVEEISPEEAGLASPGIIEHLLGLPNQWFGAGKSEEKP